MDPDAALTRIRELAAEIISGADEVDDYDGFGHLDTEAVDIAEAFQGLDGWIKSGGFLPKDWRRDG
jgi:hypothetical protein